LDLKVPQVLKELLERKVLLEHKDLQEHRVLKV
jgi:hypothetical protein